MTRQVTEREYAVALEAVTERGVAPSIRRMLGQQLSMPKHITTMRRLSNASGISLKNTNRLYGQFCGRIRRELSLPYTGFQLEAINNWPEDPIDAAEEFAFRFRPAFAKALQASGLCNGFVPKNGNPGQRRQGGKSDDLFEGTIRRSHLTTWERNQEARRRCIEHFGLVCKACGLSFEKRYGSLGKDFIEVHHVTRFARDHGRRRVDPAVDLVPLCSNCHRMVHRREPPVGVEELRRILKPLR